MHQAVFEAGWVSEDLLQRHREVIKNDHHNQGREIISLDWTLSHHKRGPEIFGVNWQYDPVLRKNCWCQTVMTAVVANHTLIDGIDIVVQKPSLVKKELDYLNATAKNEYEQMEELRERLLELLHHLIHRKEHKTRPQLAVEMIKKIEEEGHFPQANYAFDNGILSLEVANVIEGYAKHWVSEIERNRNIMWGGKYQRVDGVAKGLKESHPESFRQTKVKQRNKEIKTYWAFTKVVRLKKYGRKRLVITHEKEDLSDDPRFFLTDALHWEPVRILETWSYRWSCESFHEFAKQGCGFESAQVRNEEAVKRHFCLSCLSQSLIQRASCSSSKSERFAFAKGKITFGQKVLSITKESFGILFSQAYNLFKQGKALDQALEAIMPI